MIKIGRTLDFGFGDWTSEDASPLGRTASAAEESGDASGGRKEPSPTVLGAGASPSSSLRAMPPLPRLREGAAAAERRRLFAAGFRFFPPA